MDLEEAMNATQGSRKLEDEMIPAIKNSKNIAFNVRDQRWVNIPQSQRSDGQIYMFASPVTKKEN